MRRHLDRKPEGCKLLRVEVEMEGDILRSVQVRGDFFAHPEELFEEAEAALAGLRVAAPPGPQPNMAPPGPQPNMAPPGPQPNMAPPSPQPNMAPPSPPPTVVSPSRPPNVVPPGQLSSVAGGPALREAAFAAFSRPGLRLFGATAEAIADTIVMACGGDDALQTA
ncbi:MAG: hypothetical protein M0001_14925 [Treponema sp.]|nr:hypothetical protein [Treponema sp.]